MATTNPITTGQMKLKLMIDTKDKRVIFAEAGKDFVDFLFNISYLPLGTVMKLLSKGCLGNIYKSIEDHGYRIMTPLQTTNSIVTPKFLNIPWKTIADSQGQAVHMIQTSSTSKTNPHYGCSCVKYEMNIIQQTSCIKGCASAGNGYVKSNDKFMVMDDLLVRHKLDFCSITLLKNLDIKNIGTVETRDVFVGEDEALKLLKASMESTTILTDVFLRNQDSKVWVVRVCNNIVVGFASFSIWALSVWAVFGRQIKIDGTMS